MISQESIHQYIDTLIQRKDSKLIVITVISEINIYV